jgi:hypothetical protein
MINGQVNLYDANRRQVDFKQGAKEYKLRTDRPLPTLIVRPRGWHLEEKHFTVDGTPISASLFDFGLYFYHNAFQTLKNGHGPYFYLPKMESHLEARLWNDVFNLAQDFIGMPRGTIRGTVLIETIMAAFEMDEILYELRDHSSGLNCGRWDYIFSVIKKLRQNPRYVLPDRSAVTMTVPFMDAYVKLLIKTCHRRGVHAMGGMAAQIPIKDDKAANDKAMEGVRADKLREVKAGHDGTWVAHPDLVPTALEVFNASGFPLPGRIPAWFGTGLPASLEVLDLRSTSVNGTLPADLGMSGNLTTLDLAGNSISGSIPATLFLIKGLKFLDLSDNNLTGELPNVSISAGDGTGVFNASGNSLYGAIGDVLGPLRKRFRQVDLSRNYFTEVIGTGFGNSSDGAVDINMNCLSGSSQRSQGDCEAFYKRIGVSLPEPPNALPSPSKKGVKWKYVLAGVLAAAAFLVVLFLVALVFCLMKSGGQRLRGRGLEQNEEGIRSGRRSSSVNPVMLSSMAESLAANGAVKGLPTIVDEFTYEQLHNVTGGFGDDNLVKHGHSGAIYLGELESGFNVVVKKVDLKSSNKNLGELGFLAKNSHGRIVPLLGHLATDEEELLVYKYMAKGDLTSALHRKSVDAEEGLRSLDWITRLKIAIGVAEALCFLHDECSPPLVHRYA